MRRAIFTAGVAIAIAIGLGYAGSAAAQYDPNAYCCQNIGLAVTSFVNGKSISISWTFADAKAEPVELHAGYSPVNGVISENDSSFWDGDIRGSVGGPFFPGRAGSTTFQAGAGNTIGSLRFTKDFYVQVWFICYGSTAIYCSHTNARPDHEPEFYSTTVKVHVASTGGSGGGSAGGGSSGGSGASTKAVAFTTTTTVVHKDGTTSKVKSTTLVDGDVVAAYGNPVKISWKNGQIAIDHGSKLEYQPVAFGSAWKLLSGTAWGHGLPEIYGDNGHAGPESGGSFTVSETPAGDVVSCYTGTVDATLRNGKYITLKAGQQVTMRPGGLSLVRHFTPPSRQFWK